MIASLPVPPLPPGLLASAPDPKTTPRTKKKGAGSPQPCSEDQARWSVAALERRLVRLFPLGLLRTAGLADTDPRVLCPQADLERAHAERVYELEALEVGDAAAAADGSDPPALAEPVSRVEKKR